MSDESTDGMVRRLVAVVAPAPPDETVALTPESRLVADLGYHSLALLELGCAVEELFQIDPTIAQQAGEVERLAEITELLDRAVAQGQARLPSAQEVETFLENYRADVDA
ncbi:acyl carrier protein [Plantactinospora sp. WMMC1484]|uniref:acyl carrier protein n=1 Tax=Plantactinospora sp. WMMC1484 TaxID=3404122 RepID=UPI003BF48571